MVIRALTVYRKRAWSHSLLLAWLGALFAGCACFSGISEPSIPCSQIDHCRSSTLQARLERSVRKLGLAPAVQEHRLSIALVDITDPRELRTAGINQTDMMYAASLPKIAILLGLMKRVDEGTLPWDSRLNEAAVQMIRFSSNSAATELFYLVGPEYIANLLMSPQYQLYCPAQGGGLWVGKEYGPGPAWQLDPLYQVSHGATASAAARFYYLLETGALVSPQQTDRMKTILSRSPLNYKFVKGLADEIGIAPRYRKAGSWGKFHSDSALVEHSGRKYIAAALAIDPAGAEWLEKLIVEMDGLILATRRPPWCPW